MMNRTILRVPIAKSMSEEEFSEAHDAISETLATHNCTTRVTPDHGYDIIAANGRTCFKPGDWILACATGVYKVTPAPLLSLRPGDAILGFRSRDNKDLYSAPFPLKYKPQAGADMVRLVPDPNRCHPRYAFGDIYLDHPDRRTAWKLVTT